MRRAHQEKAPRPNLRNLQSPLPAAAGLPVHLAPAPAAALHALRESLLHPPGGTNPKRKPSMPAGDVEGYGSFSTCCSVSARALTNQRGMLQQKQPTDGKYFCRRPSLSLHRRSGICRRIRYAFTQKKQGAAAEQMAPKGLVRRGDAAVVKNTIPQPVLRIRKCEYRRKSIASFFKARGVPKAPLAFRRPHSHLTLFSVPHHSWL